MVATFLSHWSRASRPSIDKWSAATVILCCFLLGPVAALLLAAFGDSGGLWGHLVDTVLATYVTNTLLLMGGVGSVAMVFGVSSAWVISRYDFAGRDMLEWMLLLPAAIPAYIIAYCYTDFFEYAGPVQSALRAAFGWQSPRDYFFPEIRSVGGAVLVMASVLYPYIYMVTRIAFRLTPASLFEIALVHNKSQFWHVGLPLARPAIVAGLALVMMEVVSDFGTVEYFAVQTITLGIFNVWLGMNNLVAAAQISSVGFLFILGLLGLELYARSRQQYVSTSRAQNSLAPLPTSTGGACVCWALCLIPLSFGFFIPLGVLLRFVLRGDVMADFLAIQPVVVNTMLVAIAAAFFIMLIASVIVLTAAFRAGPKLRKLALMSSTGYAFPGTILAIGVLVYAGYIDHLLRLISGGWISSFLIASMGLLMLAYLVRFQAVGYGAMLSGVRRLPENLMSASRVLGHGYGASLRQVILPLLKSSFLAGLMLVFVDIMKELPMTLLLRPFDFETLATHTYQFAKDEMLEQAALPALMIVVTGLIPVILMSAMLRRYR
ncbi:MAG: iron ABC transporter permease [Alphaproteobacteria bacterium]|jgi:iron(III) transport system permease protein